jgi:hypothetical protein
MYDILIALVVIIQIFNKFSLEIELFRQSMRYYSYRGYNYVKKWFSPPPKIEVTIPVVVEKYEDKYKKEFELAESSGTTDLKYNILMENTPNGNVLMFYDSTNDSFVYYSDKVIPYRFLDTVGRKYVIHFKCKNVYIIDKSQAKNQKGRLKIDVKECANRYMYLGKIANFSFLQKVKKSVTNKKLNMSFKDFKNMNL